MEMLGKFRRMYFCDKLSLHQIAKRTGLSRNTIRKWVRAPEATQPAYQRCATFNKPSPFHEILELALKADSFRAKHNRRSAKALFEQIKAEGYDGGYSQLTAFIRAWRGEQGKSLRAFVPLTFALSEAFQFDWREEGLLIGGLFRRIQFSHMKLYASRAFWLVAYLSQGHEMLFDAHTRSFGALGGVPHHSIYDNMKTAVDKVNKGKSSTVNARFSVMYAHYLFDPDFCNVASVWEKASLKRTSKTADGASGWTLKTACSTPSRN
jgi:transposase